MDRFDELRLKWKKILTGGEDLNLNNKNIIEGISEIDKRAEKNWNSLEENKQYLWKDLDLEETSEHVTANYERIRQMALAFCTKGSKYENNKELLKTIIYSLDWMYENLYNENCEMQYNWWPWHIGGPLRLNDSVVLIYDHLSKEQVNKYMTAVEKFMPDPTKCGRFYGESTGANRIDVAKVVGLRGVLIKDEKKIMSARDALTKVFEYVTEHDGFYKDGSFIQHGAIPYTCSYGAVLIDGLSVMLNFLGETDFEVTDPSSNNVYNWIYDSYAPLIYNGAGMDMVRGRGVSRYFLQDHVIGHDIITSILRLAQSAKEPHKTNFKSMVKGWFLRDTSLSPYYKRSIPEIMAIEAVLEDETIIPKEEIKGHFTFASMDRVVHKGENYALGLSMYSKKIQNYEDMNDENKKAWYTSDGMMYLYNDDLNQFSDDFWPTVNPYRMPGTTVDTKKREVVLQKDGIGGQRKSTKSWVGGVTFKGLFGTCGMDLEAGFSTLEVKKSWFMFQKEIVALGAGISSSDNRDIETIVENRKIKGQNAVVINGKEVESFIGWKKEESNLKSIYLEGNVKSDSIGYCFLQKSDVVLAKEERQGSWRDINCGGTTDIIKKNYFNCYIKHGKNPKEDTYAYVIIPNAAKEETVSYGENPRVEVLKNNKFVQAVTHKELGITGINFWEDREEEAGLIKCSNKASLMYEDKESHIEISISDPTMEGKEICLEILAPVKEVLSKDDNIKVNILEDKTVLKLNVEGAKGQIFNIKLSK